MTALASAAFRYALRGFAVFPLAVGAKVPPAGSHGLLDGTTDLDVTRARWLKTPRANIGAATGCKSRIWVFDVDHHHDGDESLAKLEAEHGPLPLTIAASTPRGGRHLYWRWPVDGPEIRNSAGRLGRKSRSGRYPYPGLDVRGEGGMIVLPPSVLADGRGYRWIRNDARTFSTAPAWLITLALPPPSPPRREPTPPPADTARYVTAAITAEFRQLEEAVDGYRNDTLNRSAFAVGQFVGAGAVPAAWAREQLEVRAAAIGLPAFEVRRTINSAFIAGLQNPRDLSR